jgi:DNA transformation protein
MATQQSCIDFILEQSAEAGTMSAKRMFGEYGLYCDGKIVALVCDEQLFVKPTAAGKKFIGNFEEGFPYPGAKAYLLISGDHWDDSEWLSQLIKITASELPLPTPKSPRKKVKG